jgi:16S rRNA (cytosine1402-N4)-methyltransferase
LRQTGADLLREMPQEGLEAALRDLSDEPDAEAVARRIAESRARHPLERTSDLVRAVFEAKGLSSRDWRKRYTPGDLHPAALTFQALRILVNDELNSLKHLLRMAPHCLRPGGRIGIISFHSGEDRLVKRAFSDGLKAGLYAVISDGLIRPGGEEIRSNPRSASAKFRWAKLGCP